MVPSAGRRRRSGRGDGCAPRPRNTKAAGRASSTSRPSDLHRADPAEPEISAPAIGAIRNCPADPPALTMPVARPRRSGGIRRAVVAIRTAGPAMPAPPAASTPIAENQPGGAGHQRCDEGADGDQRDAAEQHPTGADAVGHRAGERLRQPPPQLTECERQADAADAELGRSIERTEKQPHGLAGTHRHREGAGSGDQHQPACPIVAAAARLCSVIAVLPPLGYRAAPSIRRSAGAARRRDRCRAVRSATPGRPASAVAPRCVFLVRSSVMLTSRLRPSSPAPSTTQPALISGFRLRVSVDASIVIVRARSPGRIGPSLSTVDSSEYWVVFRPHFASSSS